MGDGIIRAVNLRDEPGQQINQPKFRGGAAPYKNNGKNEKNQNWKETWESMYKGWETNGILEWESKEIRNKAKGSKESGGRMMMMMMMMGLTETASTSLKFLPGINLLGV